MEESEPSATVALLDMKHGIHSHLKIGRVQCYFQTWHLLRPFRPPFKPQLAMLKSKISFKSLALTSAKSHHSKGPQGPPLPAKVTRVHCAKLRMLRMLPMLSMLRLQGARSCANPEHVVPAGSMCLWKLLRCPHCAKNNAQTISYIMSSCMFERAEPINWPIALLVARNRRYPSSGFRNSSTFS